MVSAASEPTQHEGPAKREGRAAGTEPDHLLMPMLRMSDSMPTHPLFAARDGDRFVDRTVAEVWSRIAGIAKGLLRAGIEPGDRVALMASTSPEWLEVDQAINAIGAATVPIYETSSAHQVTWMLQDSGAVLAIVENDALRDLVKTAARETAVRDVLSIEGGQLDALIAGAVTDGDDAALQARLDTLGPDTMATIIYTSGTTGRPKGCVLTHGNLRSNVHQITDALGDAVGPDDTVLLFLPLAHVLAKMTALYALECGTRLAFATDIGSLAEEFPMARPTLIAAVPRIFEKVFHSAQHKAELAKKGRIFERAVRTSIVYSRERSAGHVSLLTRVEHAVFDKLVYGKIVEAFGGNLRMAFSGGGPLGERLTSFFDGVGVRIYEGYGLTETSPILTINRVGAWRSGTVGPVVRDTDLEITQEGEIVVRGPQVFEQYWQNAEATADVIDRDGWFHTGDVGDVDDDGFVRITGRIKDLIVTAAGKNVAPAPLEDRLRAHHLVSQAMVVGDGRPFIAALFTIDDEAFATWADEHGRPGATVASMVDDPELRAEIQEAVDFANESVSKAESIRSFAILPHDLESDAEEVTPTLKVRRMVVMEHYAEVIDKLYG